MRVPTEPYAALIGAALAPDYVAAAIDYVGVSDAENFLRTIPAFLRPVSVDQDVVLSASTLDVGFVVARKIIATIKTAIRGSNAAEEMMIPEG